MVVTTLHAYNLDHTHKPQVGLHSEQISQKKRKKLTRAHTQHTIACAHIYLDVPVKRAFEKLSTRLSTKCNFYVSFQTIPSLAASLLFSLSLSVSD